MKDGLDVLFALQEKDDQIKDIETTLKELPLEIEKLEKERDSKVDIIESAKSKLQSNTRQREKFEKEISRIREKIAKYREQMNKATTNREYQGFISEIKFEEEKISQNEEKIIEQMVESDEIMQEIRQREDDFREISAEYNRKIEDFKTSLKYQQSKLAETQKEKQAIRSNISDKMLRVYDTLFIKKAGKVVSLVETDFCGICNIKIRPQLLSDLISTDKMFVCENCGRILFKKILEQEAEKAAAR